MKCEYVEGCVCTSLTVDGVETADMKEEDLKSVIKSLIDKETDIGNLQQIWESLVMSLGESEDLGQCEECGDFIYKYTYDL